MALNKTRKMTEW